MVLDKVPKPDVRPQVGAHGGQAVDVGLSEARETGQNEMNECDSTKTVTTQYIYIYMIEVFP